MPTFLLRNCATSRAYPNCFHVILTKDDGYELQVGGIAETAGRSTDVFWAWSCIGANGREPNREAAMAALKAAWSASDADLIRMRRQQESTEWKYALWDAGYRSQMANDHIRCRCGAMFAPDDHEAVRVHIEHIGAPR